MSDRVECPRCFNKQPAGCRKCRGTGHISLALCGIDGCIYPTDHEGDHMPMPEDAIDPSDYLPEPPGWDARDDLSDREIDGYYDDDIRAVEEGRGE